MYITLLVNFLSYFCLSVKSEHWQIFEYFFIHLFLLLFSFSSEEVIDWGFLRGDYWLLRIFLYLAIFWLLFKLSVSVKMIKEEVVGKGVIKALYAAFNQLLVIPMSLTYVIFERMFKVLIIIIVFITIPKPIITISNKSNSRRVFPLIIAVVCIVYLTLWLGLLVDELGI